MIEPMTAAISMLAQTSVLRPRERVTFDLRISARGHDRRLCFPVYVRDDLWLDGRWPQRKLTTYSDPDYVPTPAEVVELVDALASGASGRKLVGVRVPPSALPVKNGVWTMNWSGAVRFMPSSAGTFGPDRGRLVFRNRRDPERGAECVL
jgi:hypothetical protein